ncbi:MAG: hypothetical protein LBT05_11385 [Planctomycetaceae bacterium]|jgi:hypothetical protein|nr:hypothetical protein [Planctomycetaceae bacterium]
MKKRNVIFLIALFVITIFGCKPRAPYDIVRIEGTVTYDGKPLSPNFTLRFRPENGWNESTGFIKENGRFTTIHTVDIDGVPTGKCTVRVQWNGSDAPIPIPPPAEFQPLVKKYGFQSEGLPIEIIKKDLNLKIDFPASPK